METMKDAIAERLSAEIPAMKQEAARQRKQEQELMVKYRARVKYLESLDSTRYTPHEWYHDMWGPVNEIEKEASNRRADAERLESEIESKRVLLGFRLRTLEATAKPQDGDAAVAGGAFADTLHAIAEGRIGVGPRSSLAGFGVPTQPSLGPPPTTPSSALVPHPLGGWVAPESK